MNKQCECRFCKYSRYVSAVVARRDPDELIKVVRELQGAELHSSSDAEYYACILNGSWPSAVEILTDALENARAIQAKEAEKETVGK